MDEERLKSLPDEAYSILKSLEHYNKYGVMPRDAFRFDNEVLTADKKSKDNPSEQQKAIPINPDSKKSVSPKPQSEEERAVKKREGHHQLEGKETPAKKTQALKNSSPHAKLPFVVDRSISLNPPAFHSEKRATKKRKQVYIYNEIQPEIINVSNENRNEERATFTNENEKQIDLKKEEIPIFPPDDKRKADEILYSLDDPEYEYGTPEERQRAHDRKVMYVVNYILKYKMEDKYKFDKVEPSFDSRERGKWYSWNREDLVQESRDRAENMRNDRSRNKVFRDAEYYLIGRSQMLYWTRMGFHPDTILGGGLVVHWSYRRLVNISNFFGFFTGKYFMRTTSNQPNSEPGGEEWVIAGAADAIHLDLRDAQDTMAPPQYVTESPMDRKTSGMSLYGNPGVR